MRFDHRTMPILVLGMVLSACVAPDSLGRYALERRDLDSRNALSQPSFSRTDAAEETVGVIGTSLLVEKSARRLSVLTETEIIFSCPITLGTNPVGAKGKEGDGRTPEGNYTIAWQNGRGDLGIGYPNEQDARHGLDAGIIGETEHTRIMAALSRRDAPPQRTALGGHVYIHGRVDGVAATAGCIGVTDTCMAEIRKVVFIRTPVTIKP